MKKNFIITLAWPEGMVTAAGAWYDKILSNQGKYRVGHAALVLINGETKESCYFDFGRYHTPKGYGRVRDAESDPDLELIKPIIKNGELINLKKILIQLHAMKATHGEGKLYASLLAGINFDNAYYLAKKMQKKDMIPYGPFVRNGTNCSRFVATILQASNPPFIKRLRLKYPFCISPSPKRNVSITNNQYFVVENKKCKHIKKSKIKAYFTSIESYND